MNDRSYNKRRKPSRLERIERKCDIILYELAIIRQSNKRYRLVDDTIDRMHYCARRMKAEAENDARLLRKVLHYK